MEIIARTPVIERVSGASGPVPQQLAESIFDGMRQQCRRTAEMTAAIYSVHVFRIADVSVRIQYD